MRENLDSTLRAIGNWEAEMNTEMNSVYDYYSALEDMVYFIEAFEGTTKVEFEEVSDD